MKQTVIGGGAQFLPQEIITNILLRLPVKSLLRFQCVSKNWKNLIKTQSFIAEHLQHSSDRSSYLLLQRNERDYPMHLYLLNRKVQVLEFLKTDDLSCAKIICSCNGLLCVEIDKYDIYPPSILLWNPATREIREVPKSIVVDDFEDTCSCSLGFGFSPIVKDYKIVRTYATEFDTAVNRVEVYSLSTGTWKEIEVGKLERVILFWETVTLNGAMFWMGSKLGVEEEDEEDIVVIVSFDIAMEVFTLMPWPALENNSTEKLTVYDNKLAIISLNVVRMFESSFVDLWVMEEGTGASGQRWTWTKKYRSNTYQCCLRPETVWRNNVVCNISKHEERNHKPKTSNEVDMLIIHGRVNGIFNYVESLVSPVLQNGRS